MVGLVLLVLPGYGIDTGHVTLSASWQTGANSLPLSLPVDSSIYIDYACYNEYLT